MEERFTQMATITYQHNFFRNNIFKVLKTDISFQISQLLKGLGLFIKPFSGGIHILSLNIGKLQLEEESYISLNLNCNDPYSINYTQLPIDYVPSDILYFNNKPLNALEKAIVNQMPIPSAQVLYTDEVGSDSKVCSHMYISKL